MSRSGYTDDYDHEWKLIMYRGAVASAIRGKRGQSFLREMLVALDSLPQKRLIENDFVRDGEVCAIGSVGVRRGINMMELDPEDPDAIAKTFGIASALVREIEYKNDEGSYNIETPEHRFHRVRAWVAINLIAIDQSQANKEDGDGRNS